MAQTSHRVVPGPGTFFFTVRLRDAGSDLLIRHIDLLRLSVRLCQFRYPFTINDAVVLPNRIHTVWTLPPRDHDFAARWHLIKSTFGQHIPDAVGGTLRSQVWQRRLWDQPVLTLADLAECRNLIRQAPVQAGLVADPEDWPYSTINRAHGQVQRATNVVPLRVIDGSR